MAFAPAVVIGHHGERRVAHLGFAGQLGLLQVGHADHIGAPAAIKIALGAGRELRALNTDVGAPNLADHANRMTSALKGLRDHRTHRVAKADMGHDAIAEEASLPGKGTVDELVGNDKVRGLVLLFERTDRRDRKDVFDAKHLHAIDIGAEVELAGRDAMALAMAREEGDGTPIKLADHVRVRRRTKRCLDHLFPQVCQSGHGVQAAAADNANLYLLHSVDSSW